VRREHVSRSGAGALLVAALALAVLALPGLASAATVPAHTNSVVLAVLGQKRALRVVEGTRVLDVPYRGTLPAGTTGGSRIRFVLSHLKASAVTITGTADHVSVQGFVVQKGKGLYLRLADDSLLPLAKSSSRLKVGALARVVVRFTKGTSVVTPVAPTTTKPATTSPGTTTPGTTTTPANGKCARSDCMFDTVVSVLSIDNSGALTVLPVTGGTQLVLQPGQVDTTTVYIGDFLHVTGTQSSSSGADTLASLDELVGCDNATCSLTLDATVDEVDTAALIVEDENGDEYQIGASAALLATNGLASDVDVHIVGTQDPNTGNYTATAITITK
jgi:hypothetical protein